MPVRTLICIPLRWFPESLPGPPLQYKQLPGAAELQARAWLPVSAAMVFSRCCLEGEGDLVSPLLTGHILSTPDSPSGGMSDMLNGGNLALLRNPMMP